MQLRPYRRRFGEVRWLPPETWHLTLLFIGEVERGAVERHVALVEDVAAAATPFDLRASGGGGRVRDRGAVAWVSIGTGAASAIDLADRLQASYARGLASDPGPRRTPAAHITVARRASRRLVGALAEAALGPIESGWTADRLGLVRSHLGADGAHYETLHEAAL